MGTEMHLLEVTLSELQRRNRAAFVRRAEIPGTPELDPGDKVVLRDQHGEFFAGTVVDGYPDGDAMRYVLHVGVRLPEEYAMQRLGAGGPLAGRKSRERDEVQAVLDALGEAREVFRGRLPKQRFAT